MLKKKQVLALVGIACVWAVSLSVVYVAASPAWTIDDLVSYMENVGRHKIWQTNWILYNEIKPTVDDIEAKLDSGGSFYTFVQNWFTTINNQISTHDTDIKELLGQGLVGEIVLGETTTLLGAPKYMWTYPVPANNPKKVSFWINLKEMSDGDTVQVAVLYDSDGDGTVFVPDATDTQRKFLWIFSNDQPYDGKLIIDELPVATALGVSVNQGAGTVFTIYWQVIIEEM